MMYKLFGFGETVAGYKSKVLNEREARAGAGLLFLFAIISFMNAWLVGDFTATKWFVTVFLSDFFIRIFINPSYAPSLIIGKMVTRGQKPEYVGASQKRWAWMLGLLLALAMFYLVVLSDVRGPVNLLICLSCLLLLFFESAFGICIGCRLYDLFHTKKALYCPGDTCNNGTREPMQSIGLFQMIFLILFLGAASYAYISLSKIGADRESNTPPSAITAASPSAEDDPCTPPQWAIDMGHAEKWKLHHGCTGGTQ